MTLPPTIHQGILNFPGATPESKAAAERLLEEDRQIHHCFFGKIQLHNHVSHHILAAYDLGASAKQLQAIYDCTKDSLDDINLADRKTKTIEKQQVEITAKNWPEFLGQEKYYASYVRFFTEVIAELGTGETLEQYIFSPQANGNGSHMLLRFVGGAVHPLIQTGYAVEFGSDAMLAQALAQTAVHSPFLPEIYDLRPQPKGNNEQATQHSLAQTAVHSPFLPEIYDLRPQPKGNNEQATQPSGHRQPKSGQSLLAILREAYDSPQMAPVMPYDPDALLSKRTRDALEGGQRVREIIRLSNLWVVDPSDIDSKIEELLWAATLLLASTGKAGRKPRLDFFLMHILTASLFLPSLMQAIPTAESKVATLRAMVPVILMYLVVRGRPRIDADLIMSYTSTPRPPTSYVPQPSASAVGKPDNEEYVNPWPAIIESVVHAQEPHTLKAIRSLYYASQQYGTTPEGGAIGAFVPGTEEETLPGLANVDGTIFVRAAGVVMDSLGWVTHGQEAGSWDRSALGWDDAWKNGD